MVTFCIALKNAFLDYLQGGGTPQLTVSSLGSFVCTPLRNFSYFLTDNKVNAKT